MELTSSCSSCCEMLSSTLAYCRTSEDLVMLWVCGVVLGEEGGVAVAVLVVTAAAVVLAALHVSAPDGVPGLMSVVTQRSRTRSL